MGNHLPSEQKYLLPSISWSDVTSATNSFRYYPKGFLFDATGHSVFPAAEEERSIIACYCNNKFVNAMTKILNPTMHFHVGYFNILPYPSKLFSNDNLANSFSKLFQCLFLQTQQDWDFYETSWEFKNHPLFRSNYHQPLLRNVYKKLRTYWQKMAMKVQRLEEENNRIFIEAYGLQDELTPDVPLSEITLTCNPHYRYGGNRSGEELEALLLDDTMKELISYSIGCMMGRYSLDEPGLIYAHSSNENFWEIYNHKTNKHSDNPSLRSLRLCGEFQPDDDGIIPVMDMDWFDDDATNRFIEFIKVAWSPETLDENLTFIADSLKPKNNEVPIDTIRRYMSTGFFKDHLKTYKKRPIYWLFSSGKQKAFECLVYLHRYNESTLSRMRNAYVTPLQGNFNARIEFLEHEKNAAATASVQRKIQKEIDVLKKKRAELSAFDDELRYFADMKISLDLDDGVKVNYCKFGNLLAEKKTVTGKK